MSVYKSLLEEHGLLRELGRRLEKALAMSDERESLREARNILLVLLRALDGHEKFEDDVFAKPSTESSPVGAVAAQTLRRQHAAIEWLRAETDVLLREGTACGVVSLKPMAHRLVQRLDEYFVAEERDLWPQLNALNSRASVSRVEREASRRLVELKKELASYWTAVSEYLASDS